MKKIAVVVLAMALLTVTFAAVPVMAEAKGQKVPVTFTVKPPTLKTPVQGESWYTPSGVFHNEGHVETMNAIVKIGDTIYSNAFHVQTMHGMWNPQTKTFSMSTDVVLYLPGEGSSSGFAGNGHVILYNWNWGNLGATPPIPPSWTDQSMFTLLHGFGSFEGQTMLTSYDGPRYITTTGWCLKG